MMSTQDERIESNAWLKTLIIGLGLTVIWSVSTFFEVFQENPYEWRHAGRAGQILALVGTPVAVVSLILWFARFKKIPSLAFVITFMIGGFWFLFSLAEAISGLFQGDRSFSIGGLMEILVFSAPLLIVSWFLWAKPKIGSVLLMLLGIGMGIFMYRINWHTPEEPGDWIIIAVFTAVPFVLGLFTFIRESIQPSKPLANSA